VSVFLALVTVGAATFDSEAERLTAHGAAAADLRAPNPEIARVRATDVAKKRAQKSCTGALVRMGIAEDAAAEKCRKAEPTHERYGSDGSVELDVQLSTAGLTLKLPKRKK
jgi:hypothetical protein